MRTGLRESKFERAARAAILYIEAHAALVAAGTSRERPRAARVLADAWLELIRACTAIKEENRVTATETEAKEITAEQRVHADLHAVGERELEELKEKEDEGGEICSVCLVRGCRIGPMAGG